MRNNRQTFDCYTSSCSALNSVPQVIAALFTYANVPKIHYDETGAFLIDRDPKHFRTILNYLRSGVLNMDRNEKAMKDLLCEADFFNIQPLVDEIRKAMKADNQTEMVIVTRNEKSKTSLGGTSSQYNYIGTIMMSENGENYEVLQALHRKGNIFHILTNQKNKTHYINTKTESAYIWMEIELTLRDLGFVKESDENLYGGFSSDIECQAIHCWTFIRTIRE